MTIIMVQAVAAGDCSFTNPLGCPGAVIGDIADSAGTAAWDGVCRSFADAAVSMLEFFANGFVGLPAVDLHSGGVRDVYAISLGLAGLVAAILLLVQIGRTAYTHDGSALAHALIGLGKAALAFMLTVTVAGTALVAADEVSAFIVARTFGGSDGLRDKLTLVFKASTVDPAIAPSLLLILAIVCIVLVTVLWFELLLRNAAVAVLIATSPIAAAGQIGETTKGWWPKLVGASIQLIIVKPVIALVFALGLTMSGQSTDVASILSGLVVLLLAVLAWPAIGRFFTFASVQMGGGMGLAALIGLGSNAANAGGVPVGADPNQFSQAAEARTMGAHTGRAAASVAGSAGAGAGGAAAGGATAATGSAAAAGGAAVTGGAAAAVFGAKSALDAAQKGANALIGKSEQMAGHAGLEGANPHANPAGYPRHATPSWPQHTADPPPSEHDGAAGGDDPPPTAPPPTAPPPAAPPSAAPASPSGGGPSPSTAASPVPYQQPPQPRVIDHEWGV